MTFQPLAISGPATALHTEGANVKNSSGQIVYLRGVNYPSGFTASCSGCFPADGDWLWGAGYTSLSSSSLNARLTEMAGYGFNTIRLIFNPSWWRSNSATNLDGQTTSIHIREAMLQVIQAAQPYGIYCVICPWSSNFDPLSVFGNQANFVTMWTQVAQMYGTQPNVIFELFNEPNGNYDAILNAFVAASAAIRQTGSTNIIITQWSYCGSFDFVTDFAPVLEPYGNMVYSNHIYRYPAGATFSPGSQTSASYCDSTLRNTWDYDMIIGQYPMFIGEIGAYTTSGSSETTWFGNCLSVLNGYGAGYTGWEWGQGGTHWELSTVDSSTAPFRPNSNSGQALVNAIAAVPPPPPPDQWYLTVSAGSGGSVSPSGRIGTNVGTGRQVTATATTNYVFDYWTFDGSATQITGNPYTVSSQAANSEHTIVATFRYVEPQQQWTVVISSTPLGRGSTTPSGTRNVNIGSSLDVTAIPTSGNRLVSWTFDGANFGSSLSVNIPSQTASTSHTLVATFEQIPPEYWYLTISSWPTSGGTTNPTGSMSVAVGTSRTVTETPATGYAFTTWTLDGEDKGSNPSITVLSQTAQSTHSLIAIFEEIPLPPPEQWRVVIDVNDPSFGSIIPNGTIDIDAGQGLTVTATAIQGYRFVHWHFDADVYSSNPWAIPAQTVDTTHSLVAEFETIPPPIGPGPNWNYVYMSLVGICLSEGYFTWLRKKRD